MGKVGQENGDHGIIARCRGVAHLFTLGYGLDKGVREGERRTLHIARKSHCDETGTGKKKHAAQGAPEILHKTISRLPKFYYGRKIYATAPNRSGLMHFDPVNAADDFNLKSLVMTGKQAGNKAIGNQMTQSQTAQVINLHLVGKILGHRDLTQTL